MSLCLFLPVALCLSHSSWQDWSLIPALFMPLPPSSAWEGGGGDTAFSPHRGWGGGWVHPTHTFPPSSGPQPGRGEGGGRGCVGAAVKGALSGSGAGPGPRVGGRGELERPLCARTASLPAAGNRVLPAGTVCSSSRAVCAKPVTLEHGVLLIPETGSVAHGTEA